MTRLWHWSVLGVLLPAVWLVALAGTGDPGTRAGLLGYAALILLLGAVPAVLLGTLLGAGVLAVARRLPPAGDPRRGRALAIAVAGTAVASTVLGAVLATGGIAVSLAPAVLGWSALLVGLPLTLAAGAAWSRWRRELARPRGPAPAAPSR
jgi:MFS family permease